MADAPPKVVVLAGPNGAGKSTSAARLLRGALKVEEFVNADTIAQGLSAFAQERVAFQAGRIMLERLSELASIRVSFGFETTLARRSYALRLKRLKSDGYEVHLLFLWLASAELAIARVAERVHFGGHDVPEETIRRRYAAGLSNLRTTYLPLADSWQVVDNTNVDSPRTFAAGSKRVAHEVYERQCWYRIMELKGEP
jgi:predicted ABC-type ATPase